MFWFYVLPLGFLLTMYTQTGYDASAHVAEETHEAEIKVAKRLWQSAFYAALFGWFVLLAIRSPRATRIGIWWYAGAREKFSGPVRNIEFDDAMGVVEEEDTSGTAPTPAG